MAVVLRDVDGVVETTCSKLKQSSKSEKHEDRVVKETRVRKNFA